MGKPEPELADVARLARRFLAEGVEAARAEDRPLRRVLLDHLGPEAATLPTASATWPTWDHVNIQVGLDAWLAAPPERRHEIVGIGGVGMSRHMDISITDRADLLEPALAARPGRVDLAAQLPLPDADARRALIRLYQGNLVLDLSPGGLDSVIERTEGATAPFLKELLRKAALLSAVADEGGPEDAGEPIRVTDEHLSAALDQLLGERSRLTRALLGGGSDA